MLSLLLACFGAAERPMTEHNDDAGWLVARLGEGGCSPGRGCAMWDTGAFAAGPQQVAVAMPCAGVCDVPEATRRVIGEGNDGAVGVLARENPLLLALGALGCTGPLACSASLDGDAVVLELRGVGKLTRVATRGP